MAVNRCPSCESPLTAKEAALPTCPVCKEQLNQTGAPPAHLEERGVQGNYRREQPSSEAAWPYFTATAVFACKKNRLYRVYVRPDELVCIWAGSGMDPAVAAQQAAIQGGLIGALIGYFIARMMDPAKKNAARKQVLDTTPLDDLIGDNPMNLRVPIDEFDEARFIAPSRFKNPADKAVLMIRHRTIGKLHLGFAAAEDAQVAMRELKRILGEICRIEIDWSEKDKRFVKRRP